MSIDRGVAEAQIAMPERVEKPRAPVKALYILSSRHSGSTILGNLLGEMQGFFHAGDLRALWKRGLTERRRCGCGVPVPDCPVWAAVLEDVFDPQIPVDDQVRRILRWQSEAVDSRHTRRILRTLPEDLPRSPGLRDYGEVVSRLYRGIATVTKSQVVVEASKQEADVALLRLLDDVDPYVVHLVRDPRAVDFSWRRRAARMEEDQRRLPILPGITARGWVGKNRRAESLRRWLKPDRSMVVRYEDLVRDPARTLTSIAELVGLPANELPLVGERRVRLGVNHTAAGNRNRFLTGEIELRVDAEWIEAQPHVDRWIATTLALPTLHRYGYPVRPKNAA